MASPKFYYFVIAQTSLHDVHGTVSGMGVGGFIDMLRYDQALITRVKDGMLVLKTTKHPTEARWKSYGIPVWAISRDEYESMDKFAAENA